MAEKQQQKKPAAQGQLPTSNALTAERGWGWMAWQVLQSSSTHGTWAAEFKVQRREKPEWDKKTSSLGPHRDFKGGNIEKRR